MPTEARSREKESRPRDPPPIGLRERKRTRTRLMIQAEALRLFAAHGYAETTIEAIAEAAAISPRTFFRYFPSKEDVVLWDEYDPRLGELIEARPADEPPIESIRALIRETLSGLQRRDREQLLARVRLLSSVPELRARFFEAQSGGAKMISAALAPRPNLPDERQLRLTAAALSAVVTDAIGQWDEDDGKTDLIRLFDASVDDLIAGMRQLHSDATPTR
jgi:AcrR family transcriptional regulator